MLRLPEPSTAERERASTILFTLLLMGDDGYDLSREKNWVKLSYFSNPSDIYVRRAQILLHFPAYFRHYLMKWLLKWRTMTLDLVRLSLLLPAHSYPLSRFIGNERTRLLRVSLNHKFSTTFINPSEFFLSRCVFSLHHIGSRWLKQEIEVISLSSFIPDAPLSPPTHKYPMLKIYIWVIQRQWKSITCHISSPSSPSAHNRKRRFSSLFFTAFLILLFLRCLFRSFSARENGGRRRDMADSSHNMRAYTTTHIVGG